MMESLVAKGDRENSLNVMKLILDDDLGSYSVWICIPYLHLFPWKPPV